MYPDPDDITLITDVLLVLEDHPDAFLEHQPLRDACRDSLDRRDDIIVHPFYLNLVDTLMEDGYPQIARWVIRHFV